MDWSALAQTLGPGIGNLLGQAGGLFTDKWKNPADAAMGDISKIPGATQGYYDPYIKAGQGALSQLEGQYGNLLKDPGGLMNQIGQSYQKSPGFDFQLKQALQAASNAAAAGGLAGSPQHEQQSMQLANNLANQDYNSWISRALGLYGQGLQGEQDLYHTGYDASGSMANILKDTLAKQAELKYQGQDAANKHQAQAGSIWDTVGSLAGAAIPFLF